MKTPILQINSINVLLKHEKIANQMKGDPIYKYVRKTLAHSFVSERIEQSELEKEIHIPSNEKAVTIDLLKNETVKQIQDYILLSFTYILNRCFEEGLY